MQAQISRLQSLGGDPARELTADDRQHGLAPDHQDALEDCAVIIITSALGHVSAKPCALGNTQRVPTASPFLRNHRKTRCTPHYSDDNGRRAE
ncbi:hypothetical protein QLX08_005524 [Tetragonisca angustula]|uniref:Uncharacterized protein n=1 Tax=Tetragonisca angustula TaxID=166442 RepID=A0AAW0ZXE2_9HYME